jgi:hypothetical protein
MIQVAIKRKTELMNSELHKNKGIMQNTSSRKDNNKKSRPVFSLEDLKVRSMLME